MRLIAIIATAAFTASPAFAKPMECIFSQKEQCQRGSPCRTVPADRMWTKLDMTVGTYSRCDAKGCDDYRGDVARSGIWANFTFPGRAFIAKVSVDGDLVEVATLNDVTFVSYGKCRYPA